MIISDLRGPKPMDKQIRRRARRAIAAVTLAVPSVIFASSSPTKIADVEATETLQVPMTTSQPDQPAPMKGALLRSVVEALGENGNGHGNGNGNEASPFEPPGMPPDRPPSIPGHHNPPNPPGQPPDRPPVRPDH